MEQVGKQPIALHEQSGHLVKVCALGLLLCNGQPCNHPLVIPARELLLVPFVKVALTRGVKDRPCRVLQVGPAVRLDARPHDFARGVAIIIRSGIQRRVGDHAQVIAGASMPCLIVAVAGGRAPDFARALPEHNQLKPKIPFACLSLHPPLRGGELLPQVLLNQPRFAGSILWRRKRRGPFETDP